LYIEIQIAIVMKKVLTLLLILSAFTAFSQDLTGTWEGQLVRGTIGLKQPGKMVLEIVQVEGRMYGVLDIYPVDTRDKDRPNVSYTVEGKFDAKSPRQTLITGRIIDGNMRAADFIQFIFEPRPGEPAAELAGRWFRRLEPVNSDDRGAGTFIVKRVSSEVSKRLEQPRKEKEILKKLELQQQDGK
jgi:hypothetical protein